MDGKARSDGERQLEATAVLRNGDSLSGELTSGRVELTLAAGPRVAVHPSAIRTLVRAAAGLRPITAKGT